MNQFKKGFTLVELIVVITILAILGTIGFLSLQGYSKKARDSRRVSDINNIEDALELYLINVGKYPNPTNSYPITYSGGLAWIQGTFGEQTFNNVQVLNKIPKDPLTGLEYAYSLLNTKKKYEIAGIYETDLISYLPKTYAGSIEAKAMIKGTYNGIALRVNINNTSYILAIPSIITSIDLEEEINRKLETIIPNKHLVLSNKKNLPSNYKNSSYKSDIEIINLNYEIVKNNDIKNAVIYKGNIDDLTPDILVKKLQEAYKGTTVEELNKIEEIKNIDTNKIEDGYKIDNYGVNFINNYLGGKAETRIYNSCDGIPHNTEKSFYTSTGVTFSEGTCDSVKQDYICLDGIWKNGDLELDTDVYKYDECIVKDARNCNFLQTELSHGNSLTVYSENQINWDSTYDCLDKKGTVMCNDGNLEGDIAFQYKTCVKGTASNCLENNNYLVNNHTYNIPQLNHNMSTQKTVDVSENNGVFRYTLDVICDNGELNSSEIGPILQSCDINYTEEGNLCKYYCASGVFDGYNYGDIQHNQSENISKIINILNGKKEMTAKLSCSNGVISKSDEIDGTITCNSGYYLNNGNCEEQWIGDSSNGYIFKNSSGVELYPASCSDLLNTSTWKNTFYNSPWNGSKFVDGYYYIKPNSNSPFKVYCDMTTDGGGWMRYLNIKGNYSFTDAFNCFNGESINNNELDCFNPNGFGISGNEIKTRIGGNDYNTSIGINTSQTIQTISGIRSCKGHNDYMTVMSTGSLPGDTIDTVSYVWLGLNYCNNSRSVGGRTRSQYMNYSTYGINGPTPGNRESDAVGTQIFIRNNDLTKKLEIYDGAYRFNTLVYPHSCKEYLDSNYYNNEGDGLYWIKINENSAFKVYCDMTTDGGGWTLVSQSKGNPTNYDKDIFVKSVNINNIFDRNITNSMSSINTEIFSFKAKTNDAMLKSLAYSSDPIIDNNTGRWSYNNIDCSGSLGHTSRTEGCDNHGGNDQYSSADKFNIAIYGGSKSIVPYYSELCWSGHGYCDFEFYLR